MSIRALIFDLDGTLVDSLPDLAEAINDLMAKNGLAAHAERAVASMVGKGVPVLVQKAFAAHGVTMEGEALAAQVKTYLGFYEPRATRLTRLFPHTDARSWFIGNDALIAATAFRNSSLQGAYFMLAARALGLDCGPMSGFDAAAVDAEFFAKTQIKSNFICSLGYGDAAKLFPRSPRPSFTAVCKII